MQKIVFAVTLLVIAALLLAAGSGQDNFVARQGWGLLSAEIMFLVLILFYWGFEQGKTSSREIALIAMLSAIAAAGRIPFAALPNVQPTTLIVIISGFVFGPQAGFAVGSTAALVSNFFLGQGPWTPWQMFAWGLAGASAGLLKAIFPAAGRKWLVVFCFFWGYLYGWIMNIWSWAAFIRPLNWQTFLAAYSASFFFDTLHAAGNALFCAALGNSLVRMLRRFQRKLTVEIISQEKIIPGPTGKF